MIKNKFFRLYAPESDAGGTGVAIDRGDDLFPETLPETSPDAVKDDPKVKELAAELDAKDKDGDEAPKKDSRIPLARHKEILEKEREQRATLERQLAQYQQGNQLADMNADLTAAENSIIKLEKEYADLLSDGENDKAVAVMSKIRATERDMAEAKSDMKIHAAEVRATERARYNTALERVESAFPTLNPDHDDYDTEIMAEVVDLKDAYQLKGLTPTAALQKAVKMIVEPRTSRQEIATSTKPNVSERDVAAERRKGAIESAAKAVGKTPASLGKVGLDSDKLGGGVTDAAAVMNMSQKEFAAFAATHEAEMSKMRGDTI